MLVVITVAAVLYSITHWRTAVASVIYQAALSNKPGKLILIEPPGFEDSRAGAKIVRYEPKEEGTSFEVPATRLDNALEGIDDIHLLKLDVEGHEWHVLRGGPRLLRDHRVRDIIFEEHNPYPTAASDLLEACGYNVYRICKTFLGPRLLPPDTTVPRSSWEPTNFLATHAPSVLGSGSARAAGLHCVAGYGARMPQNHGLRGGKAHFTMRPRGGSECLIVFWRARVLYC